MARIDAFHLCESDQKQANSEGRAAGLEPKNLLQLNQSGRLYAIADGPGSPEAGSVAIEALIKGYFEATDLPPEKRLRDTLQRIHQNLIASSRTNANMATPLLTAIIRNNSMLVANVGDNRAFLVRDGKLRQVTNSRGLVDEMLVPRSISDVDLQPSQSQSLGSGDPNLQVELHRSIRLRPNDIILLCSSGLARFINSKDILAATSEGNTQQIAERLMQTAKSHGRSENMTVFVIQYGVTFSLPTALTRKTVSIAGIAILTFALLAFFSRSLFAVPTVSPTATPLISTPIPSRTVAPTVLTSSDVVDCQYTVQDGDLAGGSVETFDTDLDHLFREDGTQDDFQFLYLDEVLVVNDVPGDVCQIGGGQALPASHIP